MQREGERGTGPSNGGGGQGRGGEAVFKEKIIRLVGSFDRLID